jgi:hypothetical protein
MQKDYLILKRASASRPAGQCSDDYFDVLADGVVVGRIFNANAATVGQPWIWTWVSKDRTPRLWGDARSRYGSIPKELAAGMSDVLFMQQISGKRTTGH